MNLIGAYAKPSIVAMLALAGCGTNSGPPTGTPIFCATNGGDSFVSSCTVEQSVRRDGTILLIHHPDGGFRRLGISGDGRGVIAADGAETAIVTPIDNDMIEVRLGDARYRIPATIKGAK